MSVYRERETRPVRRTSKESQVLPRRGDRPIITQAKPTRKPVQERNITKPEVRTKGEVSTVRDEKVKKQVVAVKSQRSRTRTRTLSPTEVKQMTRERIARDYGAVAAGMIPPEPETTPAAKESDQEETEDYEDDFEDYESDFEEDSEEEVPKEQPEERVPSPEPVQKTDNQKRELEEIKKAIMMENETTRSRMNAPNVPDPNIFTKEIPDFSKSRRKTEANKAAEKVRRRGRDLFSMINLDSIAYSFLDLPSIPYEVYMKTYGKSDTKQVYVQTNEDDMDEETETEVVEMRNKWVQKPTDALGEKKYVLTMEESLGVGGDGEVQSEPAVGVIDTTRLNEFLDRASDILIPALRKSVNFFGGCKLPDESNDMHFSNGFIILNVSDLPFLEGKAVTALSYVAEEMCTVLTVHTDPTMLFSESVICVWSITDLSKPTKVLTAPNRVTALCAVVQALVFAGLSDGTMCLWDLKESSALFHRCVDSDWVLRSPTYSTAQSPGCHVSPIRSVHVLREASEAHAADFTPMQVCSLEENGSIIIWSVVQGSNLSSDDDFGLAHWGKVKLVKSSTLSVISTLGKEIPPYVTCNALAVDQHGDIEMYVTNSLGSVAHMSRYGTCIKPKTYKSCDLVETTCLEICPFDPNYFIAGCNDGSIRNQEMPLISLNACNAVDSPQASIIDLAWLYVRPFVFFALDSLSRIHIWDLGLSDMYPEITLNVSKKKVSCVKLIQSSDIKQRPHFMLGTKDGKIEIHRLKNEYSNRSSAEIQKDFDSSCNVDQTCRTGRNVSVYKFNMMVLDWLKPLREYNTLSCGSPPKAPFRTPEDLDEVLVLESKVVSAMIRLQKCGQSDGLHPEQIVDFLSKKHGNLDGDIESQVITALQSGIRKGLVCGLCNGKYALIGPNPRKMVAQCYNTIRHGPQCTCSLITAGKRHCCSFKYNARCEFIRDLRTKKRRSKLRRATGRGKEGCAGECYISAPSSVTMSDACIQCHKKKNVSFSSLSSIGLNM